MRTKSESLLPPSFDVLALENLSRTCESLLPAGSPTRGIACGRRLADNCPPVVAKDLPIPGENSPSHRQFSSEVPPNACFNAYGGSGGPPHHFCPSGICPIGPARFRSEEHTSELQSLRH